ncbi:GNAT family N-acetyltransferase [Cupriavidus basilensis]|uniref:GNAT family N-acetyltransferase n=1 Tax=Cupriavidus basilensis TaxID=68895 RepID=A0ABT6AW83_9BURK|nr:GNAT family N-acetyltransferase [Cupriavidus basilensis]MDF3836882.1 GNAT family N-acetyltransferase [Cupriavidus basilensis]
MDRSKPEIVVTDRIDEEMEAVIASGLDRFNEMRAGYGDRRPLAVVVKDPLSGRTLGGAAGRSSLGLLFLDLFYLPESLRGSGLGTRILKAFEDEGRRRGCRSAVLYTISFQAPAFYARNGWRSFGEIPCDPPGTSRVFMTKML